MQFCGAMYIGVLKIKFHCFQCFRTMLYSPERAARIIYTCAVLHNIALDSGDWTLEELGGGVPPAEQPEEPGDRQALGPCEPCLRERQQHSAVVNLFLKYTGMASFHKVYIIYMHCSTVRLLQLSTYTDQVYLHIGCPCF